MPLPRPAAVRISLLLMVLIVVGFMSAHQRVYSRNWHQTLQVTAFPVNGDGHLSTEAYTKTLSNDSFGAIDKYGYNGNPLYPAGFANILFDLLYPQRNAEIMAGRIPTSAHTS